MVSWQLMRRVLDLADKTAETLGPFIEGDRPDDPILGPYHDYTRWVCDSYANIPAWATGVVGTGAASWLGLERSIGQTCRPYLGAGAPTTDPPFTGGQCPVQYQANYTSTRIRISDGSTTTQTNYTSLFFGPSGLTPLGPVQTAMTRYEWSGNVHFYIDFDNGRWYANLFGSRDRTLGTYEYQVSNVVLYRLDGLPDNCGDPPVDGPTKSPFAPTDPGPNPPGGGQPPTWTPRGPVFHPGPIKSPFNEPDSPVPPIDPWNPRGGGPDDPFYGPGHPKPGDPGEPGTPEETTDGGDAEGEVPDGHELVSLLIEVTHSPYGARKYCGVYYRAVCWVFMGNEEGMDMDYAGSMMGESQLVLAETSGLTHWRVRANLGYRVRVTPFSREVEAS